MNASIAESVAAVRERIARACARAGREPASVTLIGVTKHVGPARVLEAVGAGLADVGENTVREAAIKQPRIGRAAVRWHFIGHLQRNKAAAAIDLFDIIHSIDSTRLAEALAKRAPERLRVLLEVNVAGEASKFGFPPAGVGAALRALSTLPRLEPVGLMTVAPASTDPEAVRPVFRTLRELAAANGLRELSMGMTDDFEVAVEEGATMVRIGRAIFGERPA